MSGLNRRGPQNEGPMTGRTMGRCNPSNKGKTEEETISGRVHEMLPLQERMRMSQGNGQGQGQGRGQGRGIGKSMGQGRGMCSRRNG